MTSTVGAVVAATAAGILAVGDWWAVARGDRRLEYVCKPGATAALMAAAVLLPGADPSRGWFVAALALCLVGDVCLMLPARPDGREPGFVPGLASFLVGHVAFAAGFVDRGVAAGRAGLGAVVVVLVAAPLAVRFVRALQRGEHPELVGPVLAYLVAIGAMASLAVGVGDGWAIGGAALFVGSDALIAETRFVRVHRGAPVLIMVTYHLALAALVASLRW